MSGVQRLLISGLLILFLLSAAHVFGDTAYDPLGLPKAEVNVPDNSSVRKEYRQIILSGFHTAYHMPAEILVDKTSGKRVKFRVPILFGKTYPTEK